MLADEAITLFGGTLPFWPQLDRQQKETLCTGARTVRFTAGQTLGRGERECIGVLIVTAGALRVYLTSDDGREVPLYRLAKNDVCVLSAACVLEHIDFTVSIEAESECSAAVIGAPAFARLCAENVHAELYAYKLAAERFSDVMWAMQQLLFIRFDARLANFLLEERSRTGSPELRFTHELIAKRLGTAREVVSRMLKYFESERCVSLSRGGISICDEAKLHSFCKR